MRNYDASATMPPPVRTSARLQGRIGAARDRPRRTPPSTQVESTMPATDRSIATCVAPTKPRAAARRNPLAQAPHAKETGVRRRMPRMETPTANTHHFLSPCPNMVDPPLPRRSPHRRTQRQGALGIIVNSADRLTLASLFERIEVPLEAEASPRNRWFRRPGADRPAASCCTARSATGTLRSRSPTRSASPATATCCRPSAPGRTQGRHRHPRLRRLGCRPARAGLPRQRLAPPSLPTSIVFELPLEERLVAAMQKLGIDFTNLTMSPGHAQAATAALVRTRFMPARTPPRAWHRAQFRLRPRPHRRRQRRLSRPAWPTCSPPLRQAE